MITLDLRQKPITVEELLELASSDPVLVVDRNGSQFVVEAADAFDREVGELARSEKFMSFLAERCKEPASVSLDQIERRLSREESQ